MGVVSRLVWIIRQKTAYYPTGPIKAYNKVFRGGGYDNGDTYCRCSYRNGTAPQNKFKNLGLRLAHSNKINV